MLSSELALLRKRLMVFGCLKGGAKEERRTRMHTAIQSLHPQLTFGRTHAHKLNSPTLFTFDNYNT